ITLLNAFEIADSVLADGVQSISELINVPGIVNLDFADVTTVMKDGGPAHMGIGTASGKDKATEAPRLAISSPLLETTIAGAKGILISITASPDIGLEEIETASQLISDEAHPDAEIIWGVAFDDSLEDTMTITVVATGFDAPKKETKTTAKAAYAPKQGDNEESDEENGEAADPSVPDDDFLALWDIVQKKRNAGN
ncbi:MAG: cell division protein FtsZ, partial [Clostridia bacterium]|nr:cell division protein FtsZ [Clostridia bacterium]